MLYQIRNAKLTVGGNIILEHFDFTIKGSEKAALVGANGAGKTVFLRMIAGQLPLEKDEKSIHQGIYTSGNVTIGLLEQTPFAGSERTVQEEIMAVCPEEDLWDRARFDFEQEYDRVFTGFGFSKQDKEKKLSDFSGGERTKIAFIRLLLMRPDLLLMDEPTNHLDLESVQWLEGYLRSYPGAVLVVSHDRFFLDETADMVYELENGTLTRYAGNYSAYRKEKQRAAAAAMKRWRRQQEEIAREEELIRRFRNRPNKASFARSRKKMLERMERIQKPEEAAAHIFTGEISPRVPGPKWILETKELKPGYELPLFELSLRIRRGQKIAVIGKNGTGKSTLLKTLMGQLPSLGGKYQFGEGADIAYFDQLTAEMDGQERVIEHFRRHFPEMEEKDARNYLAGYLFRGSQASEMVGQLSGGEKARLRLAEILCACPNMLILDEPTNHMDLPAKETLESAFQAYRGTMLFVSHDRYLVSQVADALLVLEGGQVWYYPFGYRHYLEKKKTPVEAENQALISGLRNVPKGSRIPGGRVTQRELSLEWEADRFREQLDLAEEEILALQQKADALQQEELRLFCEGEDRNLQEQIRKIRQKLDEALLIYAENAAALDELTGEEEASPQTEENREMSP